MPVYSMWSKYFVHPNKISVYEQYQYHGYGQNTSKTCIRCAMCFCVGTSLFQHTCVVCMPPLVHHTLHHSFGDWPAWTSLHRALHDKGHSKKGGTYSCSRFTKALKAPDGIDPILLKVRLLCNARIQPRVRAHTPVSDAASVPHACTLPPQHHPLVTVYLYDVKQHVTRRMMLRCQFKGEIDACVQYVVKILCTPRTKYPFINNANTADTGKTRRKLAYTMCNVFVCGHQPFSTHVRGVHATLGTPYTTSTALAIRMHGPHCTALYKDKGHRKKGGTYSHSRFTKASKAPDGIDPMLLLSRSLCNARIKPRVRAHTPLGQ